MAHYECGKGAELDAKTNAWYDANAAAWYDAYAATRLVQKIAAQIGAAQIALVGERQDEAQVQ